MMLALKDLSDSVQVMKSPTGANKKQSARSCLDIYLAESETGSVPKSGKLLGLLKCVLVQWRSQPKIFFGEPKVMRRQNFLF